jgi:NADPH-dependent 2,4-dienoyl-CoA reductase/sulfur reductase-like enzyme
MNVELVVIGAGPAGLAAASEAYRGGVRDILLLERDALPGGILNQCIHNGFGLHIYKEELTGPEYAAKAFDELLDTSVVFKPDTMVLSITPERVISALNHTDGYFEITAGAIILAMGCRERTRGAISIPGSRPAGVLTAGAAQRYVNIEGCMVGREIVVLGSGDIGLIMARRMTLEGAKVLACVELMPFSSGLTRNVVQCLQDYDIPLLLSHTITDIKGRQRVESVTVSAVDENRRPIPGTETEYKCDTVLLSVGLIPENELSKTAGIALDPRTGGPIVTQDTQTSVSGIFACGNVLQVHDLVDNVTLEARKAGRAAAAFLRLHSTPAPSIIIPVTPGDGVTYTVPQTLTMPFSDKKIEIHFRVNRKFGNSDVILSSGEGNVLKRFAREQMTPGEIESIIVPATLLMQHSPSVLILSASERFSPAKEADPS